MLVFLISSCEPNYLPVAGDCVHQDWIIGLSAGIGGAILVALVITIIVMCRSKPSSKDSVSMKSIDKYVIIHTFASR